jgi:hypothetical protein
MILHIAEMLICPSPLLIVDLSDLPWDRLPDFYPKILDRIPQHSATTLAFILNISSEHWMLMILDTPKRTFTVYDSNRNSACIGTHKLTQLARCVAFKVDA